MGQKELSGHESNRILFFLKIFLIILGVFLVVVGLWCVDIGVSGMVLTAGSNLNVEVTNGFFSRSSCQQYHAGLWLVAAGMFMLVAVAVYESIRIFEKRIRKEYTKV